MNALLAAISVALGAAIALTLRGGSAAVLLCASVAFVVALFISRIDEQQRAFILRVFVAAVLVRVAVGTIIYAFRLQDFFGGDALTYDYLGSSVMYSWHAGIPVPQEVNDWARAGGGWGMIYLVAGVYYVTGANMLAVQYVNAVIGAATAPVIFLCARHIFRNLRVAKLSAVSVAFYPSLVLWSSQGLKDGPIVFLLALAMLATLKLGERLSVKYTALLSFTLYGLFCFRFYIFYMAVAAVVGAFFVGMRPQTGRNLLRQFAVIIALGLTLTYMGVLRTAGTQMEVYGDLDAVQRSRADLARSANSGFGQDVDVSTASGALSAIPVGMTYLFFAPFPWQIASLRQSITLPEMVVWWASFPLLVMGIWFTVKYRMRQALPILIFTSMLTLAYSIFQGNVGTAYRQRSQILVFYFIFVAVGAILLKERYEDRERTIMAEKQARVEAARMAEAQRRYERWKREREKELEGIAQDISERIDF